MAVQAAVKDAFTFVGGLNTEGGFFVTPENSWKEGVNVVPTIDGSIERRNGLDYETNYALAALGITAEQKNTWAFTSGVWTSVGGNSNLDFIVVQAGTALHFYRAASGTVSNTKKSFTVNLNSYLAPGNPDTVGTSICSFASTYGKLIVTSKSTEPILITYDSTADTISVSTITIKIRDFIGFQSPYAVNVEKTEAEWTAEGQLTQAKYNLYNQGWTDSQINTYKSATGNLPANSKSWIFGKDTNDDFSASVLNKQDFGTSPAPKGRFILNAFSQDRSGIVTAIAYRPRVCAFFAGRVWYAGMPTTAQLGTVYFSQVLDDINKVGDCYQSNDPTSEVVSDLEDDDGGTIEIPDSGEILSLEPLGRGIMVIATNGIWFISGIDRGFTAASYSVERVSSVGCVSTKSVVVVEDTLIYWSNGGIYAVAPGNTGAEFSSRNISDQNIKTFYQNIPVLSKLYAEGTYNATDKLLYWLYSSTETEDTGTGRFNKNSVLALDLRLNAWYWFDIDTSLGVIPVSIEVTKETNETSQVYDVYVNSDDVNVSTDDVVANIAVVNGTRKTFKVVSLHPVSSNNYSLTFADFLNTRSSASKFKDWYSFNTGGVEKEAYFLTGYNMGGNGPSRSKSGMYLTVFMKRTETAFDSNANPINESGCLMQSRWDFTDNTNPGKWADEVQVYRQPRPFLAQPLQAFDDGYPLVISKNKLRGRGKAVQFRYRSEAGKDMKIVGWTGTFVGSTNV
jgi:hypothetical protein